MSFTFPAASSNKTAQWGVDVMCYLHFMMSSPSFNRSAKLLKSTKLGVILVSLAYKAFQDG